MTLREKVKKVLPDGFVNAIRPIYHWPMGVLAPIRYGSPGKKMTVIGVTGTNGKSTTANLIAGVLEADGKRVGLATTVNFQVGEKKWMNETKMTSSHPMKTQRLLAEMLKAGCTHAVIEVSSHALYMHRMHGIPFQTAVFTNLSRDHLDLHGSMEAYKHTKGKLFAGLAKCKNKTAVIVNGDDSEAPYFLEFLADEKYVYGTNPEVGELLPLAHSLVAEDIKTSANGSSFTARTNGTTVPVTLQLPGSFNVSNALAAVSTGLAHGVHPKNISAGLAKVAGVPGRMEQVDAGQPFNVIVDYAHTPDAFENVLKTLKPLTKGKLITVFGATGDRDKGKRPDLGKVAARYSDFMILTEEDPGSENPKVITEQILPGISEAGKSHNDYEVSLDRRKAIARAVALAKPEDTVVLLGKGHETVMVYSDEKRPWDDRKVAREELQKVLNKGK